MYEIKATCLTEGDEFTIDDGETWRTVQDVEVAVTEEAGERIVFCRDVDGKRFWLWTSEKVIVR
jgi:hypothetical protein